MKSMNRQFGKLLHKGQGDSAQVSVLISDYETADKSLGKIIDASKNWRDAWTSILGSQLGTLRALEDIYNPILGSSEEHRREHVRTPQLQLDRTAMLKETSAALKADLLDEVTMMDTRIIEPATQAKEFIQPIRKTIKKRDNKRLDWERSMDKVNNAHKKMKRTERENAALVKAEEEFSRAAEEFKIADDHLRETLPLLISATFSIFPRLLEIQIMIQNTLLAQYYTVLHNYCTEAGFPSPPPPMDTVISEWGDVFKPVQREVESFSILIRGKAVHSSMSLGDDGRGRKSSGTSLAIRSSYSDRRVSSDSFSTSPNPHARVLRVPSPHSLAVTTPRERSISPGPQRSPGLTPNLLQDSATSGGDYFQQEISQKRKPPPPPPKKLALNALIATALYSFTGEGHGDLSFQEGDQITVLKKTDSTDDWWTGELNGIKGSFPANYCKIG